jgi:transposase InsO family protein
LWVTDITEHRTYEGKVYCTVVLDTFSRRVVGWSIDSSQGSPSATATPAQAGSSIPTTECKADSIGGRNTGLIYRV